MKILRKGLCHIKPPHKNRLKMLDLCIACFSICNQNLRIKGLLCISDIKHIMIIFVSRMRYYEVFPRNIYVRKEFSCKESYKDRMPLCVLEDSPSCSVLKCIFF